MAPIKTAVILPDRSQIDLIIPVNSEATFDTLQALAVERAARHHSKDLSRITSTLLRLGSQAGPFLYEDDRVQEVISPGDIVFVILTDPSTTTFASQNAQTKPPAATSYSANDFKLRVITPHLAHCHEDIRTIPVLDNGKVFSALSTLRDLRRAIANSLDITLEGEGTPPQVCNCKLAEMSSVMPHLSAGGDLKILVVSGSSNTRWMDVPEPTQGSIMTGLKQLFGETFENANCIHLKGGAETDNGLFTRLPVVSICAKSRHSTIDQVTPVPSPVSTVLDLHTAEGPIHTGCLDASAEELGLTELIVNGVLSLYAVERRTHSTAQEKTIGKDAIFSAARYWVRHQR